MSANPSVDVDENKLLSAKRVAELLDMSTAAVYAAAERGHITGVVRIGRSVRFQSWEIARLIRRGSVPGGRAPAKP